MQPFSLFCIYPIKVERFSRNNEMIKSLMHLFAKALKYNKYEGQYN